MYSFLKILNHTSYPAISVEEDDRLVAGQVLNGDTSPTLTLSAGSLSLLIRQHTGRPFLSIWLAMPPDTQKILVIEDETAFFT